MFIPNGQTLAADVLPFPEGIPLFLTQKYTCIVYLQVSFDSNLHLKPIKHVGWPCVAFQLQKPNGR